MVFLLALCLVISVLAKRLAGKSLSDMTYIVSSGTLNLNSINAFAPFPDHGWILGYHFLASKGGNGGDEVCEEKVKA